MRCETVTVRHGENVGPVDWTHETAKDMPDIWREAERDPKSFVFDYGHGGRAIVEICMYDGWPYWQPRPAVAYIGALNGVEWAFFNSYGVHPGSITKKIKPDAS